ncbi:hypothetical protein H3V53_32860 [Paraburkholderia bengalensis]|uniref:UspA domain-containing protein n=1 Tax=Paraburkholderia bengalensis TaxID=2747562 RepID=A0ABU8J1X7_9BURK
MCTHGRNGGRRIMLRGVTEAFLPIARCPILVISAHIADERQ